ncbi:TPA: replication initiation protein, partial [Enterococcus faecium]|nr:replication initiation protein [Enterococcus faecium]HAQ0044238.1 replication initiation protein [Enterococcus faecium]HAQ0049627.1 replication initiation protein [Enterococcus faecium]HAQ0083646.1 replication initiation protein [Enterococcus faecium]HAQ0157624.1 replication initiation protein [Enterococcus faecium]
MSQEVTEKIIDSDVDLVSEQTNAIVRYNNGLNTTALRGFKPVEMDVFWAILSKMKRQGTAEVTFDFNLFRYLVKYDRREKDSFYSVLKALSDKLGTLTYRFEDSDVYEQLWLFQKFRIDKQKETVTIKANEEFEFILNSIGKNFTRFELDNFTKLRSSYTKELYRHLMQYRNKEWRNGYWVVKVEDFRR